MAEICLFINFLLKVSQNPIVLSVKKQQQRTLSTYIIRSTKKIKNKDIKKYVCTQSSCLFVAIKHYKINRLPQEIHQDNWLPCSQLLWTRDMAWCRHQEDLQLQYSDICHLVMKGGFQIWWHCEEGVAPTQPDVVTGVYAQTGDVFLKCVQLDASLAQLLQCLQVLVVFLVYEFSAADLKSCDC